MTLLKHAKNKKLFRRIRDMLGEHKPTRKEYLEFIEKDNADQIIIFSDSGWDIGEILDIQKRIAAAFQVPVVEIYLFVFVSEDEEPGNIAIHIEVPHKRE